MQEAVDEQGCATSLLARIIYNKKRIWISEHGSYLLNQAMLRKKDQNVKRQ